MKVWHDRWIYFIISNWTCWRNIQVQLIQLLKFFLYERRNVISEPSWIIWHLHLDLHTWISIYNLLQIVIILWFALTVFVNTCKLLCYFESHRHLAYIFPLLFMCIQSNYSGTLTLSSLILHCHLHPLQAANCCRNSRLVVDEDDL